MRETAIVIVSYRTGDTLARCLDDAHDDAPEATIYLVDHASRMVALDALLKPRLWVRPLATHENPGFGAGANRGIEQAFADGFARVLLLNDDVFLRPGCVAALKDAVGDTGAASPWLAGEGDAAYRGGAIDWERGYAGHREGATDYLLGGCMMISRGAWERTGPFDESFFLYCEDVDWCIRARSAGVDLIVVEQELADHIGGASTAAGTSDLWQYWWTRNRLVIQRRYGSSHGGTASIGIAARLAVGAPAVVVRQGLGTALGRVRGIAAAYRA